MDDGAIVAVFPVAMRGRKDGAELEYGEDGDPAYAIRTGSGGSSKPMIADSDIGVRRLTPLEATRLQGYPDGWNEGLSDAQRYRQLGNSVALPVVSWIAERLVAKDLSLDASDPVDVDLSGDWR